MTTAATCLALLHKHSPDIGSARRFALAADERNRLRLAGLLTEPKPVTMQPDSIKDQIRTEQRAALNRAFDEVKARWGMHDLPKGEVKSAAMRHGCDHQLLLNKFYKARLAQGVAA